MIVSGRRFVPVQVPVLPAGMAVGVGVKLTPPPPDQHPQRERHDHNPHGDLGAFLDRLGEVAPEQHNRQAEQDQGSRVSEPPDEPEDRKSTRLNSSHRTISFAVFCLKKKKTNKKRYINKKNQYKTNNLNIDVHS